MSFSGFIKRLILVVPLTWIIFNIIDSPGWALYFALMPVIFYEMLRPRRKQ